MNSENQLVQENKQNLLAKLDLKLVLSVFLGLIAALFFVNGQNILLKQELPFAIGVATANEIDIAARIGLTYKTLFLGIVTTLSSYFILKRWISLSFLSEKENIVKGILIVQIILSLCILTDIQKANSFWLLNALLLSLFLVSILPRKIQQTYLSNQQITVAFIQLISLFLIIENWWITWVVVVVVQILIARLKPNHQSAVNLWITILPLIVFLGVESTLIANQRSVFFTSYLPGIILFSILIGGWLFTIRRKILQANLIHIQLPLVLVAYLLFQYYTPVQNWHEEFFEIANELNPLLLFELYGKIPFVDYLSSHLVSDFFWHSLYATFNGFNYTQDPLIYRGFVYVCSALVLYFFLKSTFSNALLAFGIIALLPFLQFYLPYNFAFVFIPFIFLKKYFETKEFKFLTYTAIWLVVLSFWRVDIGVSLIAGVLVILPLVFWEMQIHRKKISWLIGSLILVGLLILGGIYFSNPSALPQMAHYFSGSQAHGYEKLTPEFSNLFYIHFIFLPLSIGIIFVSLLVKIKDENKTIFYYPLLFLIGFYFMNLQRGLVRHSFMEHNETSISSIGWMIVVIFAYHFTSIKKMWVVIALIPGGLLLSIRSIDFHTSTLNKDRSFSLHRLPALKNQKITRTVGGNDHEVWKLVDFFKANMQKDETFIDLSNTPMLYYYTQKNVPSYFCQYMQNTIDGFLQEENIRQLSNYKIPYVVFSREPESFFDNMDGIQNPIRHYRITDYIYQNYLPYKIIGGFQIWISKDKHMPSDREEFFSDPEKWAVWNLGLNSYFWKPEKQQKWLTTQQISFEERKFILQDVETDDFLSLQLNSEEDQILIINQEAAEDNRLLMKWTIQLKKGVHTYIIPVGCSYSLQLHKQVAFEFHMENPVQIQSVTLKKLQIEH